MRVKTKDIILYFFIFIFTFIVFLLQINKPIGIDVDSLNYFNIVNYDNISIENYSFEPVFLLLISVSKFISDNPFPVLLAFYFILSSLIKIISIKKSADYFLLSFFAYIAFYLIVHDIIQIRIGLATAFFLLSLPDIANKKLISFLIKITIASLCHYSALIAFPLYFLNGTILNRKKWIILLSISFFISLINLKINEFITPLLNFMPTIISAKVERYTILLDEGVHSNLELFNYYNLIFLLVAIVGIIISKKIDSPFHIISIKILLLSQCAFYILSFLPVLAYRYSEFLGITIIYVITYPLLIFNKKELPYFLTLIFLVLIFLFNLFIKSYIDWSYIRYYDFL